MCSGEFCCHQGADYVKQGLWHDDMKSSGIEHHTRFSSSHVSLTCDVFERLQSGVSIGGQYI